MNGMIRYLARRAAHGLLMLFGVSILMFLLFQTAPGDFLSEMQVNSQISAETIATTACRNTAWTSRCRCVIGSG